MNSRSLFFILGATALLAAGCSSGGVGLGGAKYCPTDYKGVNLEVGGADRTPLSPDKDFNQLKAGEYAFNGMQLYYNDHERNIRLHIQLDKAGVQNSKTVICSGGTGENSIKLGMEPVMYQFPVVDKIVVDASGKSLISFGIVSIDLRDRGDAAWLQVTYSRDDKAAEGSLKDVYAEYPDLKQYFYKFNDHYETRANMKDPSSEDKETSDSLTIQSLTKFIQVTQP